ncbi:MAG: hypothetical protein KUG82_19665 [Pseudomonadales bacterium]|nr:hypothetical protein [Pseudomonadales bacterium]
MDTNAQNTLVIIFQHVDIFCTMLDHYSDRSKTVVGFQVSAYEAVVTDYLEKHVSQKTDRSRINTALSLNNMDECGLLIFVDDRRGQFALQRGLLQTIQNLDSKRIRELGQPDLDIIYAQMKKLYDYFIPKGRAYERYDPTFQENLATLIDSLQETLTKIDHNTRALEGSSKRLSEILESHDFNQMGMSDQVRSALDEVIRISKRNINPTLVFLNEKAMAADASAMYLIRRIRESFERTTFHSELATISTIEMKLLSYAEVIADVRRRMHRYVEMDRCQRELYNNIESRFNELYEAVVSRLDAKLTGKKIPSDHVIFECSRQFRGLAKWNSAKLTRSLIALPDNTGDAYVHEYIRSKLDRAETLSSRKKKPSQKDSTAKERYEKSSRLKRIKAVMLELDTNSASDDLYKAVHEHLVKNLEGYRLKDIYDALPFVGKKKKRINTFERKEIIYQSQRLSYLAKKLEVA